MLPFFAVSPLAACSGRDIHHSRLEKLQVKSAAIIGGTLLARSNPFLRDPTERRTMDSTRNKAAEAKTTNAIRSAYSATSWPKSSTKNFVNGLSQTLRHTFSDITLGLCYANWAYAMPRVRRG